MRGSIPNAVSKGPMQKSKKSVPAFKSGGVVKQKKSKKKVPSL